MDPILARLETELKLRGFTQATLRAYKAQNRRFLEFIKKDANNITEEDIKVYLGHLISERNLKPASVGLALSCLRYLYEEIMKKKIFVDVKAPKIEKKLPTVLTKYEIKKMLDSVKNPKHRLLIEMMYASGLRVSECVRIKINDLDFEEHLGRVISGKGKKDRNIILSEKLVKTLQSYLKKREEKSDYVFPSHGTHLTVRMAQKIVSESAKRAGIRRRVYCHAIRSTFATHLLEAGTDIRVIQELLGHSSISTTERYTRVSTEQIKKVRSPLDEL